MPKLLWKTITVFFLSAWKLKFWNELFRQIDNDTGFILTFCIQLGNCSYRDPVILTWREYFVSNTPPNTALPSYICEVYLGTGQRLCGMLQVHGSINRQIITSESLKRPNDESRIIQHHPDTMYIPLQRNCVEKSSHGYPSLHSDIPRAVPPTHHLPLDHHALQWYGSGTGDNFFLHIVKCHYVDFMFMSLFIGLCVVIWNLTRFVFLLTFWLNLYFACNYLTHQC